jgi:uncharacterized membrane protein YhaH (DUF805 family)
MTFPDSIGTCFRKYADFSGVAIRSEFWWWALFCFVAGLALDTINVRLGWAFTIATFLPYAAVTTRRLHDTNRSGWWQLLVFVPVVGWILLIIFGGERRHYL